MARPVTLFTGQWADLKIADIARKVREFGYDGLELACWGDHFDVGTALKDAGYCAAKRDMLAKHDLQCHAISNHLVGQAVLDNIDERHKAILPPHVWGDGKPEGVTKRAIEEMKNTARAAQKFGVSVVNGFTGSSIWHLIYDFPPVPRKMIDDGYALLAERWNPILDVFAECGVKFALEVHPTEIAFDIYRRNARWKRWTIVRSSASTSTPATCCGSSSIRSNSSAFPDRIYHVHMKDAITTLNGRSGILASHLSFDDSRRGWNFRSPGRGGVNFEEESSAP
ncbi:MAG: TIM barrel protein [Pirellulales bacterium]